MGGQAAVVERDWDDVWKLAVALDYELSTDWRLKTGFSYETSPQDDPNYQWVDLPVGEQYRYSIGASTQVGDYTIDMFYEYADFGDVDMYHNRLVTVDGTFSGQMHFIGMNVTF
jgi:long-subunit fatty acid transport protein